MNEKDMTEEELDLVSWKCGRGTHYEGYPRNGVNKYAIEIIEEDAPRLVMEVRQLQARNAELAIEVETLRSIINTAKKALQSYAFGNQSPELAKEVVEWINKVVESS